MKKSRVSEEQIIGFIKQAEAGITIKETYRKGGFSDATSYKWRAKFGGMDLPDARKLRELESENAKLKKLLQHITRTGGVSEFLCVRRDCLPKVLGKRISS